jgi:hypothetical protein
LKVGLHMIFTGWRSGDLTRYMYSVGWYESQHSKLGSCINKFSVYERLLQKMLWMKRAHVIEDVMCETQVRKKITQEVQDMISFGIGSLERWRTYWVFTHVKEDEYWSSCKASIPLWVARHRRNLVSTREHDHRPH